MKMLLLNGHGINMRVDGAKLHIKDGRFSTTEVPKEYVFSPKRMDIDSIVVYGRSGSLSLEAIRWLIKHNVQITLLDWNGKLLTTILPSESTNVKTKFAQYHAYEDKDTRVKLAKKFIEAKFSKSEAILDYLKQRYPEIESDFTVDKAKLEKAKSIREILGVEGGVAWKYWNEYAKAIPEEYDFRARTDNYRRANGAGDKVNVMLNYGYALLESECLRAINSVGLDAHVGFLHEMNPSKNSLAYDFQEPFRFIVDIAVMNLIEKGVMDSKDFIRTESFSLRLRPTGARKLTEEFNSVMNGKVEYRKKNSSWGSVLLVKARELSHQLVGKRKTVDFVKPVYIAERDDSDLLRKKIIDMPYVEWTKMGFSKGTLHYMKQNAMGDKPFTLNTHVKERLDKWEKLVSNA
ncbi:CRISPR-associated endonuclease Cas1 [Methanococcoides seepicolus]|uniref:CRISPR-associated endonuclease Cas1 n=1 Tax=Methanococcoides seepicolus TaxID=2828780 RepID=A0A9E4ZI63_9EURY|nr:CRISPR-associated endonuclease Cas1 [Methanococcoides seepicolus]MCM1987488.1 CRISPR-associated endonuclease Cas1 [Methanococcoides seepicolus]